jgi:thiol-disulfide isomerase/thioredoxin
MLDYLFLFLGVGALFTVGVWRTRTPNRLIVWMVALLGVGLLILVGVFTLPQDDAPAAVNPADEVIALIDNGQPTILMMYSHFCADCVAALPGIGALVSEVRAGGQPLDVLTLDIDTRSGQAVRNQLEFSPPMVIILFDADGAEVLRDDDLPTIDTVRDALTP